MQISNVRGHFFYLHPTLPLLSRATSGKGPVGKCCAKQLTKFEFGNRPMQTQKMQTTINWESALDMGGGEGGKV